MSDKGIKNGQEIQVYPLDGDGESLTLRCHDVAQRNWSRVAKAEVIDGVNAGQIYFVKQYTDKSGVGHRDHWIYERDGAVVAADALVDVAHVPRLQYRNEDLLLNVFEYTEVVSIDVLLRKDPEGFNRCILSVVRRMAETLAALQRAGSTAAGGELTTKFRNYGGPCTTINFKGFEIRNAGVPPHAPEFVAATDLVLFDFVRPYLAPSQEAGAKLFVSIGLLNWGSPLTRFRQGPDLGLLEDCYPLLHRWLDADAVMAELDLQERFRTAEFKGSGSLETLLKRIGLFVYGKVYLYKLRRWCAANLAEESFRLRKKQAGT